MNFLIWKLPDHRFNSTLLEVARIVIDMYSSVIGLSEKVDSRLLVTLQKTVDEQIEL